MRIVLELKKDADPELVMAYLYKHTPLQTNFHVNLTCLVPPELMDAGSVPPARRRSRDAAASRRCSSTSSTSASIVDRRAGSSTSSSKLKERIHILEGFATIFDALDETIKIIRASDGKDDAAEKLMKRFKLDEIQADAILELKLYKLAKLEIHVIREELEEKAAEAKRIETLLKQRGQAAGASSRDELDAVAKELGTPRRTKTGGASEELEFDAEAFIVDEDAHVVVTRDGWIKRVRELKDPNADAHARGRRGRCTCCRARRRRRSSSSRTAAPPTSSGSTTSRRPTGYGDPVQKLFKFGDGEQIVAALSLDPRAMVPPTLLAVTRAAASACASRRAPHTEITTQGRPHATPSPSEGDEVARRRRRATTATSSSAATRDGHVLALQGRRDRQARGRRAAASP